MTSLSTLRGFVLFFFFSFPPGNAQVFLPEEAEPLMVLYRITSLCSVPPRACSEEGTLGYLLGLVHIPTCLHSIA